MTLLEEIQRDITNSAISLSAVLRKAMILATRLKSDEFRTWVELELNGYERSELTPDYRKVNSQLVGEFTEWFWHVKNYPIPMSILPEEARRSLDTYTFTGGVRELESLVENDDPIFRAVLPADLNTLFSHEDTRCIQVWKQFTKPQVELVLDTIRNRLLAFVLEIEELNPNAGDKTAPEIPSEKVSQTFSYTILGGQQVIASGMSVTQNVEQRIVEDDFKSLRSALEKFGVGDDEIEELHDALASDGNRQEQHGFGPKVAEWVGKMTRKVVDGTWKVAIEVAPALLTKAISDYYGWNR